MERFLKIFQCKTLVWSFLASALVFPLPGFAISVTQTTDATVLATAVTQGASGLTVTGAALSGHDSFGIVSSGTYSNASGHTALVRELY